MGYGNDNAWLVWSNLRRKEEELKWCGHFGGTGHHYDSMGRPADASRSSWGYEQMGRVERVRRGLADSGPSAQRMIADSLSGINLSSIWHILISVCEDIALYYGGSVIAGGVFGGVCGAFFAGVGAVPGAAAGAAAGSYIGSAVLSILGLKSLVEGVFQAVPRALEYYERGFQEAWGPTRQDRLSSSCGIRTWGNPSAGAFYLAHGHVIMITTILSVLVAYVTRGKGNKEKALKEISESPRLGPKVAQWVKQNEAKLSRHPMLQPNRGGGGGGGGITRVEPLPPRRPNPDRVPDRPRPTGMPKKAVPCFKTNGLPQGSVPEFDRQLAGQEAGINNMTVEEYIKGREAFDAKEVVRDPQVALKAREEYRRTLEKNARREYRNSGLSRVEAGERAAKEADEKMKALAALHNPDMVAGGKDVISDFGNPNINKRIGAQWRRGGRLRELDEAAKAIPASMRGNTKMNAKLERCK